MKNLKSKFYLVPVMILGAVVLSTQSVFAQEEASRKRVTISAGGLSDFKDGAFLYTSVEYSLSRRWSLNFAMHRDDTREEWSDGSRGYYFAYAPALSAKWSWFPNGRGFFAQAGVTGVNANLKVTEAEGSIKRDSGTAFGMNYKYGYRWSPQWGRKAKGFFVEAMFTNTFLFSDLIIQTDATPAETPAKRPNIDWHSWNNYKFEVGSSFLLGVGYTF